MSKEKNAVAPEDKPLSTQESKYVNAYIQVADIQKAGKMAGYKHPHVQSYKVHNRPHVQKVVRARQDEMMQRLSITPERVLSEFACSAFFDPETIFDENGQLLPLKDIPEKSRRAIASIKVRKESNGETDENGKKIYDDIVEIKLNDKTRNLEDLAKNLGVFEKDNKQKSEGLIDVFQEIIDLATSSNSTGGLPVASSGRKNS